MIKRAAEVVCGALALGGSAMLHIAPPANSLATTNAIAINHGILMIVAVLLYVTVVAGINYAPVRMASKNWNRATIWLGIVGVVSLVAYVVCRPYFVVNVEGSEYLIGMWRDEGWAKSNPELAEGSSQEVADTISIEHAYSEVWLEGSRMVSYLALMAWYLVSTLMVLGAMFCASESRVWARILNLIDPRRLNGGHNSNH